MRNFLAVPNSQTAIQRTYQLPAYQHPNESDFCLAEEAMYWDAEIATHGLQNICCPNGRKPYATPPWVTMPQEGRRYKPIGVLPIPDLSIPGNLSVEFTVVTEIVPVGYDGVITDVVCEVTAPNGQATGFTEGSGDVIWRLRCNGRLIRDFGNVQTSLGSLIYPNPTPRGKNRILSNNTVYWTVTFAPAAAGNLNPSGSIICSLSGWTYPR